MVLFIGDSYFQMNRNKLQSRLSRLKLFIKILLLLQVISDSPKMLELVKREIAIL
jgi:hypothetical protein